MQQQCKTRKQASLITKASSCLSKTGLSIDRERKPQVYLRLGRQAASSAPLPPAPRLQHQRAGSSYKTPRNVALRDPYIMIAVCKPLTCMQ